VSEEAAPGWGDISGAAPHLGLARHAPPSPILYTLRVNKMSFARRIALASLVYLVGRPFLDAFLDHFGGISEGFPSAPQNGAITGLTYLKIGAWGGYPRPPPS
jgi:hypothetical protein